MTDGEFDLGPSDIEYIVAVREDFKAEADAIVGRLGLSHMKPVEPKPAPKVGVPISEVLSRYASRRR